MYVMEQLCSVDICLCEVVCLSGRVGVCICVCDGVSEAGYEV